MSYTLQNYANDVVSAMQVQFSQALGNLGQDYCHAVAAEGAVPALELGAGAICRQGGFLLTCSACA